MFCSVKYHPKWAYQRSAGRKIFEGPPDAVLLGGLLDLLADFHDWSLSLEEKYYRVYVSFGRERREDRDEGTEGRADKIVRGELRLLY